MNKKIWKRIVAISGCAVMALSGAGCGEKKVANDANTLEMFICDFGYGTKWLEKAAEEFKKTDWVTAKYPELKVDISSLADQGMAISKVMSGEKGNTADLLFTAANSAYVNYESGYFEDLTAVYEMDIPGETITMKDKMIENKYTERVYITNNGEEKIYSFPWVNGFQGLFMNVDAYKTILGENYVLPRTSDELAKMCEDIKNSSNNTNNVYPFFSSSTYYTQMFTIWWAQYEGLTEYANYYNGIADGELSNKIFAQKGRLRALETLEEIMGFNSGNVNPLSQEYGFMQIQANFFKGNSVMIVNGDWLETEMSGISRNEITVMKNPVISSITEKTSSVKSDTELAFVVQCVDDGKDFAATSTEFNTMYAKELAEADYTHIYEARKMIMPLNAHEAYIPSYAVAKDLAKDFLLFLASDKGIEVFMKETSGAQTAFAYDVEQKNPTLYNSFSTMQKEHAKLSKTAMPALDYSQTRLVAYGGLQPLLDNTLQNKFLNQNANARQTAQEVYNGCIENYNDANGRFDILLQQAGLIG